MSAAAPDGLPTPRRYVAAIALSFGTALAAMDGGIVNVALPTLAHDLDVSPSSAVLVVTVYQLVLVMMLLPCSALGDRIGHRRLYQYGQVVMLVATLLCFFAKSLPFLLVVRAIQALGAAAVLSLSAAMVRAIYPSRMLGRGLGINSVVVSSAAALAPTLGGLILTVAAWPWVFAATVPLGLLSLLLGRNALPASKPIDEPYDVLGALLSAASFGLLISGVESLIHGDSPVVSAAVILFGAVLLTLFVRRALGQDGPILPVDLLGRPVIALSVLGAMTGFMASMTLIISLPFRLQREFGLSPDKVGAMIAPWPLGMMVMAPLAGMLSDRLPAGLLGGVGMAIATAALVLLGELPPAPSYFDIAWRMALCGAGFGLFFSPNARLIIGSTPPHRSAASGGLISTTRLLGQTLGATLFASLLALGLGYGATPAFVAAGLALIAGLCSLARLNPAIRRPAKEEVSDL